jgi:hypothetical protein
MTLKNRFKLLTLTAAFCGFATPAFAQLDNAGAILRAGAADANILMAEYMKPFGRGFGAGLNSGWFGVAKTHKFLGFDLAIRATVAQVPTADQSFDLNDLSLTSIRPMNNANTVTPTISGMDDPATPVMVGVYSGATLLDQFEMPEGTGLEYVPTPMVQVGVGALFNTDVMLRYIPETEISDIGGSISLFGIGVKHDIKQWIPVVNMLPIDIMGFYGMTQLTTTAALDETPRPGPSNSFPDSEWENQEISLKASGTNMGIIVGKSIPLISVYGGIGRQTASTDVKTSGNYPVVVRNPINGSTQIESIADPVNISIDGANASYMLVGARLKLLFLTVSADYTIAEYPMASVGVGFTIR